MHITKPAFIVNTQQCSNNIQKMAAKAKKHQLNFRPHFKTHQSVKIAELFKNVGVTQITVSSLVMAEYFAKGGWNDITVAFPVNILEMDALNLLASKVKLNILVESEEVVRFLSAKLTSKVGVFIKIDAGYNRTGVLAEKLYAIRDLIQAINNMPHGNFLGFLSHAGNTYQTTNIDAIQKIHTSTLQKLGKLKELFTTDFLKPMVSIGDTPSCSIVDNFEDVDEIRPGNFVYYDATQLQLGSCAMENMACFMACPVVAKHSSRNEIVIYGGAVHFSKDYMLNKNESKNYGWIVNKKERWTDSRLEGSFIKSLSQEHGIIAASEELYAETKIGDLLYILPIHSCLTANLMKHNTLFI